MSERVQEARGETRCVIVYTDAMVERAAQALARKRDINWAKASELTRDFFRRDARAFLTAALEAE